MDKDKFIEDEICELQLEIYDRKKMLNFKIEELNKDIEAYKTGDKERLNAILWHYRQRQFDRQPKRFGVLKSKSLIEKREMIQAETDEKVYKFVQYFGVDGSKKPSPFAVSLGPI